MAQKRHRVDQIISKLRRADVELGKGKKVPEVCKRIAIADRPIFAGVRSTVVCSRLCSSSFGYAFASRT